VNAWRIGDRSSRFRTCVFHPCIFVLAFSVLAYSIPRYLSFPYLRFQSPRPGTVLTPPFLQRAAMLALQALYYSYGNSVCLSVRQSVTRWYCVKTAAHSTRSLHCRVAKCVCFVETKKYSAGTTPSPEMLAPSDLPLLKAASFNTFCTVAPQPQEIEKEVQLHLTRTRHGLSNKPSTKVLRRP